MEIKHIIRWSYFFHASLGGIPVHGGLVLMIIWGGKCRVKVFVSCFLYGHNGHPFFYVVVAMCDALNASLGRTF